MRINFGALGSLLEWSRRAPSANSQPVERTGAATAARRGARRVIIRRARAPSKNSNVESLFRRRLLISSGAIRRRCRSPGIRRRRRRRVFRAGALLCTYRTYVSGGACFGATGRIWIRRRVYEFPNSETSAELPESQTKRAIGAQTKYERK